MPAFGVVKQEVFGQTFFCFGDVPIRLQVDVLVCDRSPQPFGEDSVQIPSAAIHTYADVPGDKNGGEIVVGELRSLVAVEYFRNMFFERSFKGGNAEIRFKRRGNVPGNHEAGIPVKSGDEVCPAVFQPEIRHIGSPHLIGASDRQASQKIGVFLVR